MPDALSRMGLSRRPELEFFKFPKGMANDPSYSQEFRADLRQDQDIQRQQKILDMQDREIAQQERAQRAVNQFTRQDPNTRQQFLEENANIALSPQFGNVSRYQENNMAARTLAPSMAKKLPPAAARRFYENIDQGFGANEAFEEARDFLDQESLRERLYGTGADDDEISKAFPTGRLSAPEIARFETKRKMAMGQDPETDALSKYYSILRGQVRQQMDTTGAADPDLEAEMESTGMVLRERLKAKAVKPAAPVTPVAGDAATLPDGSPAPTPGSAPAPAPTPKAPAAMVNKPMSYQELVRLNSPEGQKETAEKQAANTAWTAAKQDLQSKLDKVIPDKIVPGTDINQREAFARAILSNESVEDNLDPVGEFGASKTPLADITLQQIGVQPYATSLEIGDKKFNNKQVLESLAQDFLNSRGKLLPTSESPTGAELTPDEQKAVDEFDKKFQTKK